MIYSLISFKFKLIYILILIKSVVIIILYIKKNKKNDSKVCVCTSGKNENKYIKEFVEYYFNYGVDNIIIYDNNDINGESFDTVIEDYIKLGTVKILNWRGKSKIQLNFLNDCYQRFRTQYDWFIFYDLDEFIHLKDFDNIKDYLNQKQFLKCNVIYLNHILHTDNNQLYYKNESLFKRFPEIQKFSKIGNSARVIEILTDLIKSIIRGNLTNINIIITCL